MSLGRLVGRFGDFLSQKLLASRDSTPAPLLQDDLMRIRETYGHHLVVLALLARADGVADPSERDVILRHCIARAKNAGIELTEAEKLALNHHLYEFRPLRSQLERAVRHMRRDTREDIIALVVAAKAIVDADGVRRPREVEFLKALARELETL